MKESRREEISGHFTHSGKNLVLFSAFANLATFSRFTESIAWETNVWTADAPDHMIHFNGQRFLGPYTD